MHNKTLQISKYENHKYTAVHAITLRLKRKEIAKTRHKLRRLNKGGNGGIVKSTANLQHTIKLLLESNIDYQCTHARRQNDSIQLAGRNKNHTMEVTFFK